MPAEQTLGPVHRRLPLARRVNSGPDGAPESGTSTLLLSGAGAQLFCSSEQERTWAPAGLVARLRPPSLKSLDVLSRPPGRGMEAASACCCAGRSLACCARWGGRGCGLQRELIMPASKVQTGGVGLGVPHSHSVASHTASRCVLCLFLSHGVWGVWDEQWAVSLP